MLRGVLRRLGGDNSGAAFVKKIGINPLEEDRNAIAKTDQKDQVGKEPCQPGDAAGEFPLPNLGDSGGTANGGHIAFIPVFEGRARGG